MAEEKKVDTVDDVVSTKVDLKEKDTVKDEIKKTEEVSEEKVKDVADKKVETEEEAKEAIDKKVDADDLIDKEEDKVEKDDKDDVGEKKIEDKVDDKKEKTEEEKEKEKELELELELKEPSTTKKETEPEVKVEITKKTEKENKIVEDDISGLDSDQETENPKATEKVEKEESSKKEDPLEKEEKIVAKDVNDPKKKVIEESETKEEMKDVDLKKDSDDESKNVTNDDIINDGDLNKPELPQRKSTISNEMQRSSSSTSTSSKQQHKPKRTSSSSSLKNNPLYNQLKDAFPNIEDKYIRAVIIASQGDLDPAFNALLYLSDPQHVTDIPLPSKPPRKPSRHGSTSTGVSQTATTSSSSSSRRKAEAMRKKLQQEEQDAILARQLDEKYNKRNKHSHRSSRSREKPRSSGGHEDWETRRRHAVNDGIHDEDDDSWQQFMEKDLPDIKERAEKSFQDTANRVSNWFKSWSVDEEQQQQEQNMRRQQQGEDIDYDEYEDNLYTAYYNGVNNNNKQQDRPRFNSFGQKIEDNSEMLRNHGVNLQDDMEESGDVPPQLPNRMRKSSEGTTNSSINAVKAGAVLGSKNKKVNFVEENKNNKVEPISMENNSKDMDDFLINSDDDDI